MSTYETIYLCDNVHIYRDWPDDFVCAEFTGYGHDVKLTLMPYAEWVKLHGITESQEVKRLASHPADEKMSLEQKARECYDAMWSENSTHSEGYVIAGIAKAIGEYSSTLQAEIKRMRHQLATARAALERIDDNSPSQIASQALAKLEGGEK